MRILVLSSYFPPDFMGGFEISASLICSHLAKQGHELDVLTRKSTSSHPDDVANFRVRRIFEAKYDPTSTERWHPRLHGAIGVLQMFGNGLANVPILRRFIQGKEYDLALCFSLESIGASLATELSDAGIPVLYSIGDFWLFQRRRFQCRGLLANLTSRILIPRHIRRELNHPWKYVIFNCENVHRKFTEAGMEPEYPFVVFRSCPPPQTPVDYEPSTRERFFLVASQLRPHKAIHHVIEAMSELAKSDAPKDWSVRILGSGDEAYIQSLKDRAAELGLSDRIEWRGKVPQSEVAAQMSRCIAFIHPATWDEPFGRVTMEAMAYGAPLIAADCDATFEIPTEECALIYDRRSPSELAGRMREVLDSPKLVRDRVAKGLARYEAYFRPEVEAENMKRVIECVLELESKF